MGQDWTGIYPLDESVMLKGVIDDGAINPDSFKYVLDKEVFDLTRRQERFLVRYGIEPDRVSLCSYRCNIDDEETNCSRYKRENIC
jgi:hypothetical protein